jgi:hypothetical protein
VLRVPSERKPKTENEETPHGGRGVLRFLLGGTVIGRETNQVRRIAAAQR